MSSVNTLSDVSHNFDVPVVVEFQIDRYVPRYAKLSTGRPMTIVLKALNNVRNEL